MATILIAGGATGIGLAAMRAFRTRGDAVLLADRDFESAERAAAEELSGPAKAFECDLSTAEGPRYAVEAALDAFGGIDTVFGNAGLLVSAPLAEWTIAQWDRTMATNLRAPFLLAQAAAPFLERSENPSLIFTSSTGALRGHAGMPAYHASKAGLIGLVRSLADELSPKRIRVNCICPGWVDTPFNNPYWSFQADAETAMRDLADTIPLRRQAVPEDVSGLILFLASPASSYITGTSIVIDGGYTAV